MTEGDGGAFDQAEIEKLFVKAKSSGEAYSFAFGMASKPEDCGLAVSLRKPGEVLKKDLKKASSQIKRVCFGTFTLDGSDVLFQPVAPLKGLVKQLKKRFRDVGMGKYRPVMVGPDGVEIDEDSLPDLEEGAEDDEDAAPQGDEATNDRTAEAAAALKARLVALRTAIEASAPEHAAALANGFAKAVGQMKAGDLVGAGATIEALEKALARLAAAPPPKAPPPSPQADDAAAKLNAALTGLLPRLRALPNRQAQQDLALQARAIAGQIAAGDTVGAVAALRAFAAALTQAETTTAPPRQRVTDLWNSAKEAADTGIAQLQQALRGYRHPDTDRIAEFGLAGLSGGSVQTSLMTALLSHDAASPAERHATARKLAGAIEAYRAHLSGNRLVAHCESNPFGVAIDLRGRLGQALDQIEAALAG